MRSISRRALLTSATAFCGLRPARSAPTLHARPEQVRAAYPRVDEFIAKKRDYDPQLRFRNLMWDKYFA